MPSLRRTFDIPHPSTGLTVPITLHEPSLTADDLGHKTWAASFLLSKRLQSLRLPALKSTKGSRPRVLELGAGTGLVGLSMAALYPTTVHLTDLAAIVPNLTGNAIANAEVVSKRGSTTEVFELDWSCFPDPDEVLPQSYDIALAADPIYGPEHPAMLVGAIAQYLKIDEDARLVVELPLRDAYLLEIADLRQKLGAADFVLLEEGREEGFDEWGDRSATVTCWWSQWTRKTPAQA